MQRRSWAKLPGPFRRFSSSQEIIQLVVTIYVSVPLSLRNVEDLLAWRDRHLSRDCALPVSHVCPLFAAHTRRQRVSRLRGLRQWRWHIGEVLEKINGEAHCLWGEEPRALSGAFKALRAPPGERFALD